MHQQSDGVTIESSLRQLIEIETWIIGTLGYMELNLQKYITRLFMLKMIAFLCNLIFSNVT